MLPQLRFFQAMELTQASTALSLVLPAGTAAGLGVSFGMLQSWGFPPREITRGMTLVSLWNQFLNLFFPIVAVFLLTARGEDTKLLATAAFIGVAILGVVVAGFALALASSRLANDVGEVAARLANWALGKVRRGPVGWGGPSFERFRASAGELLRRRWHVLTLSSLVGSLSVYLVLLVCLRALDVPASEVSAVEAFAAWSLVRLLGTIPITPGGVGVVELALTTALIGVRREQRRRRRVRARVPVPDDGAHARLRAHRGRHLASAPAAARGDPAAAGRRGRRHHPAAMSEDAAGARPPGKWKARADATRGRALARADWARENLPWGDVVTEALERERIAAAGLLAGGLAYRLFFWIVPLGLVFSASLGFWVDYDSAGLEDAARDFGLSGAVAGSRPSPCSWGRIRAGTSSARASSCSSGSAAASFAPRMSRTRSPGACARSGSSTSSARA